MRSRGRWGGGQAIGPGGDEACLLTCLGHEAPCGTKLGPGSEDERRARDRKKDPNEAISSAVKPLALPEKMTSEKKNKPTAARFATTGPRPPPR